MSQVLKPADEDQVRDAVAAALAHGTRLEIVGGGTKRGWGRPVVAAATLDVSALTGISLYEPAELVMTADAGTPMREINRRLTEAGQHLAFEPPDLGPLLGTGDGATIGGTLACNLAGPRRIQAGAARDHFLGFRAVSGRGEFFKSGGRVVKNVTGYDLCKLMAGSFGTLGVLCQVTFKVLPAAEAIRTVLVTGLDHAGAVLAMAHALRSPHDVSGAAHLPAPVAARSRVTYVSGAGTAVTALRLEGTSVGVEARCAALRLELATFGPVEELHSHNTALLWREVAELAPLTDEGERCVWRISVPPASGAAVAARIEAGVDAHILLDWGGGLVWAAIAGDETGHELVRGAIAGCGGHATLLRATPAQRAETPPFQPPEAGVAALTRRIKEGLDPKGILNPGRMYEGV
jgi:glycolate oxidase FAD binding subunit